MSEQEQQQQIQQEKPQEEKEFTLSYKSLEELENDIQKKLLVLFNKDNFLNAKYFVTNCINENLEVEIQSLIRHNRIEQFFQLKPAQLEFLKKPQQFDLWKVFYEQIEKCSVINWNRRNNTVAPKFDFERSSIVVRDVEVYEIEEFEKFIKGSEVFEVLKIKSKNSEGEEQVPNLVVTKDKSDQKIIINGYNEAHAQKCFEWLLSATFGEGEKAKKIKDIQMQRFDYYTDAYFKLYQQKPTSFKKPQQYVPNFQAQQQQQLFQQQMYFQQMNMYYNNQNYRRGQNYKQFNGQTQQHQNQYHGKRHYNNNYNHNNNNQYSGNNYQGRNGNNRNYKNRNNNYHGNRNLRQNKPINIDDHKSFPGLNGEQK